MAPSPAGRWAAHARCVGVVALALVCVACIDPAGDTLPAGYHAVKATRIVVMPRTTVTEPDDPTATVRAFNGIHGAPAPVHPELADLLLPYWNRPSGSTLRDGSHVEVVRVGPDVICAAALDGLFPQRDAPISNPASYSLDGLRARFDSVVATQSATLWWQASLLPDRPCGEGTTQPLDATTLRRLAEIAVGAVGQLTDPASDSAPPLRLVEFLDAPLATLGLDASELDAAFSAFTVFAEGVRALPVAPTRAPVAIVGLGFVVSDLATLADDAVVAAPIRRFIDFVVANAVPLDVLSVRIRTQHPSTVAAIAGRLRTILDDVGLSDVAVAVTEMRPSVPPAFDDDALVNAHLGAFETAARVYLQGTRTLTALSGRGPLVLRDGRSADATALSDLEAGGELIPSDFFTKTGDPRPAYMMRFPFRQIQGDTRLVIETGGDQQGLAILASRPEGSTRLLDILIVNANVHTGSASMTWDLVVPGLVPPQVRQIDFRLSVLDHRNTTLGSFFFSELGTVEPHPQTGDVRIVRELPIPGVHYLQIEIPTP